MEDRKTIFDYIGQIFAIFGATIGLLNLFCLLFGEGAQGHSSMFSLGKEGLTVETMLQFLLASVCTVSLRFLFFTETFIKNMTVLLRTICMVALEIVVIILFILTCGWFPTDMCLPWVLFFLSFGICFGVSVAATAIKERMENRKMEEALERLKKQGRSRKSEEGGD